MVLMGAIVPANCRLCHSKPGQHNLNSELVHEIFHSLQINVNDELKESLPHAICTECKSTIRRFFVYKELVTKADATLRAIAKQKKETDSSIPCVIAEQCPKETAQESAETIDSNDGGKNCNFLCVTCGKRFKSKKYLVCHEKTHLDSKLYTCAKCNVRFSAKSNLRAHQRKYHEGVRFYCSQCPRTFTEKWTLGRHEKIHGGVKEFQCSQCPAAFYTSKELIKHRKYHEGTRPHQCDECCKSFHERHHLVAHRRTHSGEKPFLCAEPECGKRFAERQKLQRHHRATHSS